MYKNRINYKLLNFLILMGLLYICVTNIGTWFQIFSKIVSVCLPFIIAFAIAYALHPLEKKLEEKGVRKSLAITFLVVMTLLIVVALIAVTLPLIYQQLISFTSSFGSVIDEVSRKFNLDLSNFESTAQDSLNQLIGSLGSILQKGTIDVVGKTVSILGQSVIVLVVTIYFLSYMDRIRHTVKKFLKSLENRSYDYVKALDIEISNYLKGLGLFMVIQFFEYSIVFFIAGHPNWLLFGILASLTTVIPYFGGLITNILALITASAISSKVFFATLIICLIFPQLDGYLISPKVYGKTNNVNPLVTIMVVSVGGTLGGMLGIVVALPIYILISSSYRFFKKDIERGVRKVKEQIK
ncbi:MAG: AI-2E family transporter [bacterium]|jgi:integral membrane protein|nr:AI-2E family transporter [bacterium]